MLEVKAGEKMLFSRATGMVLRGHGQLQSMKGLYNPSDMVRWPYCLSSSTTLYDKKLATLAKTAHEVCEMEVLNDSDSWLFFCLKSDLKHLSPLWGTTTFNIPIK